MKKWVFIVVGCVTFIIIIELFIGFTHIFHDIIINKEIKIVENLPNSHLKKILNDSLCVMDEYTVLYRDSVIEYNCLTDDSASIMVLKVGHTSCNFSLNKNIVRDSLSQQKKMKERNPKYSLVPLPTNDFIIWKPYFVVYNVENFNKNVSVSQLKLVHTAQIKEIKTCDFISIYEIKGEENIIRFYKNDSDNVSLDIQYVANISSISLKTYLLMYENCNNELFLVVYATKNEDDILKYQQLFAEQILQ